MKSSVALSLSFALAIVSVACSSSSAPAAVEDAPATQAQAATSTVSFAKPLAVAVDPSDAVWVIDSDGDACKLVQIAQDGTSRLAAKFTCGSYAPGFAVDAAGNATIALERSVVRIAADGTLTVLAAAAADSSRAASSTFGTLQPGVYLDASGNFFVIDATTTNTRERKITAAGVVSTVTSVSAVYGSVQGSAILAPNNIYTTYQNCVVHDLLLTSAGSEYVSGSADGAATTKARFDFPSGIVGDKTGTLFVADTGNNEIRKITPAGVVSTLAGAPVSGDWVDGVGAAARFNQPQALAIDSVGNVYVVEQTNRTIRKVTPAGVVSTFASPCGAGCPTGSVCQGNACVACTGGLAACGGIACLDLQNDDGNCGACGHACTTGNAYMCSAGKCTGSTIDMDFGASTTKKTGVAWTGFPADVWNAVNTAALPPDLVLAWNDGTPATGVSVTATNLQGAWGWAGEKPVDPMYANYNYSWGGDSADVALHGLPDGRYAAVVFGKQGKNNTGFYVTVEDASGGVLLTTATSYTSTDADTAKYTDENQLVVFAWMDVHAGQTLRFHLLPGAQGDGNAGMILNGLQLVREHL